MVILICKLSSVDVFAQTTDNYISFSKSELTLGKAISEIEKQTQYVFAFDNTVVDTLANIRIEPLEIKLKDALDAILEQNNYGYFVRGRYIVISFVPKPKEKTEIVVFNPKASTGDIYTPTDISSLNKFHGNRPRGSGDADSLAYNGFEDVYEADSAHHSDFYSQYEPISLYSYARHSPPRYSIKTNMLYAATGTLNAGLELGLDRRSTLEVTFSVNPWKPSYEDEDYNENKKLMHIVARVEYRRWFCERFGGHFLGANVFAGEYNISGHKIPFLFDKKYRYRGNVIGAGLTYGYNMEIAKRWGVEFHAGLGFAYLDYSRYTCFRCSKDKASTDKFYFGPTRVGISLVYLFK